MESVNNIIIEHLRAMRADIASIREDVREVKTRLTNVEHGQGTIVQHLGHIESALASQQLSHDRLVERVERLEHRSEISQQPL
jgi:hypothetical protein